jgi:hypothetical protein
MRYALHNNEDSSERRFKTLKELWSYVRKHDLCSEQVDVTGMADAQKLLSDKYEIRDLDIDGVVRIEGRTTPRNTD